MPSTYARTITITYMVIQFIVNIQTEDAVHSESKVGVCNYRGKSDPLQDAPQDVIRRNVDNYMATIRKAAESEHVKLIIFPEGGLTTLAPFHENRDVFLKYSLNISGWENSCPCDDDKWSLKGVTGEAILKLSCAAKSNRAHVVVNILEKELLENDLSSYNIFSTNLVFNDTGHIIIRYRKNIPDISSSRTDEVDNNIFTVGNREYKTIIGNDIYKESYILNSSNNISIVWSTASQKMKSTDIPGLILAQVYGKVEMDIFISDYSDDEWSNSCIYYKGNLYSFGEQSDDELIIVPSDNESENTRRKLNSNSIKQFESIKSAGNNCSLCSIDYKNASGTPICLLDLTTGNDDLRLSFCGIVATHYDLEQSNNVTINWKNKAKCEILVPITADMAYWPLNKDMYEYNQAKQERIILRNTAKVTIFALMSIRNISKDCKNNDGKKGAAKSDQSDNTPVLWYSLGILVVLIYKINI